MLYTKMIKNWATSIEICTIQIFNLILRPALLLPIANNVNCAVHHGFRQLIVTLYIMDVYVVLGNEVCWSSCESH